MSISHWNIVFMYLLLLFQLYSMIRLKNGWGTIEKRYVEYERLPVFCFHDQFWCSTWNCSCSKVFSRNYSHIINLPLSLNYAKSRPLKLTQKHDKTLQDSYFRLKDIDPYSLVLHFPFDYNERNSPASCVSIFNALRMEGLKHYSYAV